MQAQNIVNKDALGRMMKQRKERFVLVKSKKTGKLMRAKESYAKELVRKNEVQFVSDKC